MTAVQSKPSIVDPTGVLVCNFGSDSQSDCSTVEAQHSRSNWGFGIVDFGSDSQSDCLVVVEAQHSRSRLGFWYVISAPTVKVTAVQSKPSIVDPTGVLVL